MHTHLPYPPKLGIRRYTARIRPLRNVLEHVE